MPRHATKTSFKSGHKRSQASIDKQRATAAANLKAGTVIRRGTKWTAERRAAARAPRPDRCAPIGATRLHNSGSVVYRRIRTADGFQYEHRVVMEAVLGRKLLPTEVVHHIDHDTLNNSPDNLQVVTAGQHTRIHHLGVRPEAACNARRLNGKWAREYDACVQCGLADSAHSFKGICNRCHGRNYRKAKGKTV